MRYNFYVYEFPRVSINADVKLAALFTRLSYVPSFRLLVGLWRVWLIATDYDLWEKYKPLPVDIRSGNVSDYYDICEQLGT